MWVYIKSEKNLWTVGHWHDHYYAGEDKVLPVFEPVEDFSNEAEARKLVHYLNGGKDHERQAS
jgi:hypothetical protein